MTSFGYIIVDSCIISLNLNCILQLKQFYDIATKVSCRKKCYYFWWSTWLLMPLIIEHIVDEFLITLMHCNDVIMDAMASQITTLTSVYPTVYTGADERRHQRSVSLAFVLGIHRSTVNCPHKWPVTRKMFPFDDVIMGESEWQWRTGKSLI